MSENEGINKLLAAEDAAAKQIAQAKAARQDRLREAREMAKKEAERLREELEAELSKSVGGGSSTASAAFTKKLEEEITKEKIAVEAEFNKNKATVVQLLMYQTTSVSLEVSDALEQLIISDNRSA
eukprot:gb/GEZN01017764.1/.p2 GENE.gb/GEZN01017764.1/~~gb/GEZN01017764.1/.p2  ORF type:complete len:126 (+),score=40.79 gb/GEZN01017764.1/:67-444(+)